MNLVQTTLFGVRGECFRIGKREAARMGCQAETALKAGRPKCGSRNIIDCNAHPVRTDPCDGCLKVGVTNCLACVEKGAAE